ncbi:MAG: 3-hydroxyacyl-CoA dehydrogenase NAD-binding domain-containing protein [Terriglobales bacterium]|jgi:3-hydroxyacyl-CoA dehydrogenase
MSSFIKVSKREDVAVITIDNPPVNALSPGVPEGILAAIEEINADPAIRAAVVIGAGRTFVAGADIKEFGKMTAGGPRRSLLPMLRSMEDSRKPVVMAIHGTAFGGGLELALAGHYRIASPTSQLGQPEVKLGLIPGAGGTQRLPRLIGVAKAVEMCAGGNPVAAGEALALGLLDRLIEGDLLAGALLFAREVAAKPGPKTRERMVAMGTEEENATIFAAAREVAGRKQKGLKAPQAAIDAVEAATKLSFEDGCQAEARLFMECLISDQSKALIHVFFGEREVAKIPDLPRELAVLPVNRVAVVGSGTMGGGIAMVFANAGIPVLLKDVGEPALEVGMGKIRKNYAGSVQRGRFTQAWVDERLQLITPVLSYDAFPEVDMVIEAVFEGMALKKAVFTDLDRVCRQGAILASNTSTLNIDEIAGATSRPEAVIGTHFFSPANVMRLLEIVRGKKTSHEVIATCMQLAKKLGKVGVLVGNCRGFVGNRMFGPYRREAQFLIEEGAEVEAVDRTLVEFGNAMGPLATGDLAGLDVGWRIRKEYRHLEKPGIRQPFAEDRLCELGRYGQKTSRGWYQYDANRRPSPDPEVTALVRKWSAEAGIEQRQISSEEVVDRCIYALVNEGARILGEAYALRAVDIDIIYLNGYGFPAYRGGPMWHANTVGLPKVYRRISEFHQRHGELWAPAPLLKRLAEAGKTFADFDKEQVAAA